MGFSLRVSFAYDYFNLLLAAFDALEKRVPLELEVESGETITLDPVAILQDWEELCRKLENHLQKTDTGG